MKAIDYIPNILNATDVQVDDIDGIRYIIWTIEGVRYFQDCTTPIPNSPGACLFYKSDGEITAPDGRTNGCKVRAKSEQVIHNQVFYGSQGEPPLNGCECPKCGSQDTYDVQYENNYYFGCVDCKKIVAIWIEEEITEVSGSPWFVLP